MDNFSTQPDFDPDLWLKIGLCNGPDTNKVSGTCAPSYWLNGPRNNQLPPPTSPLFQFHCI
jgi:hypothetical protein